MKKMFLFLYHGRHHPDEEMNDWGFEGPFIGPLDAAVDTYHNHLRVVFEQASDFEAWKALTGWTVWDHLQLEVKFHDDMIEAGERYYGDWEFQMREVPA